MTPSAEDLTVLQANLLAAAVATPGSMVAQLGEAVESVYGIDLPSGRVYNEVSRLSSLQLIEKSAPRGAQGKAITPTPAGRDLVDERYDWIADRIREEAEQ